MTVSGPYGHFIDKACQLDYEDRLVGRKLEAYERWSTRFAFLIVVFAPSSAVGSELAKLPMGPEAQAVLNVVWQVLIVATSVLALAGGFFVTPKLKSLRSVKQKLDGFLAESSVVLDRSHYQGAGSPEWIASAQKATESYSGFSFEETFSTQEMETAWAMTLSAYAEYFKEKP